MPIYALILFCLAGFLLLYFGAEWLVKGASNLARGLGITPIEIGRASCRERVCLVV